MPTPRPMTDADARMRTHLLDIAEICERMGSPFTGKLLGRCAED